MKHSVTRELYEYWSRLRGARAAPDRQDIDPAAIRKLLWDTFILEVDNTEARLTYTIRLSGTRFNALFMAELKGRGFTALWQAAERDVMVDLLGAVVDDCSPLVAGLRAGPEGHRPIDLEMVLLPLKLNGRTHARILGAIAPIEIPSWLGLLPAGGLTTLSFRLLGIDPPHALDPMRLPMGEPPPAGPPRRYGPFVVHQGGR